MQGWQQLRVHGVGGQQRTTACLWVSLTEPLTIVLQAVVCCVVPATALVVKTSRSGVCSCVPLRMQVQLPQLHYSGVQSSLMHHHGCSGLGTRGLTSTHDTNTARKYCKTASNASGCTMGLQLLLKLTCRSTTTVGYTVVSCVTRVFSCGC